MKFERLFQPIVLGGMELKNRFVMAAMSSGFATKDGLATGQLLDYFEARARGGVGLIVVGYACIDFPAGMAGGIKLAIDHDRFIPRFAALTEVIHRHGAKVALQLNHAGGYAQKSTTGTQPVAPSPVVCNTDMPRELTIDEIHQMVTRFAEGAGRARKAGFDAVEIHACTAYLICQFLTRAYNRRKDQYGGDMTNRARFLLEILGATRAVVGPDYPIWARINGKMYGIKNGTTIEESQELAGMLQEAGCCAVSIKAGGEKSPSDVMAEPAGKNLNLAEAIKKAVKVPVMIGGRMTPEVGERALQDGLADLVVVGRALIADPDIPNKVATGRLEDIRPCLACGRCQAKTSRPMRCAVNPEVGREPEYRIAPAQKTKHVLVVGGGPAGLEAARVAALRGHTVTLCETKNRLGGQLEWARRIPYRKPRVDELAAYLAGQTVKAGVKVELRRTVTTSWIDTVKPDVLVLATGSRHPLLSRVAEMARDALAEVRHGRVPRMGVLVKSRMMEGRVGRLQLKGGDPVSLVADSSSHELLKGLTHRIPEVYIAGDYVEVGGITEAIDDGARIGREI